jgi:hypothetical protein
MFAFLCRAGADVVRVSKALCRAAHRVIRQPHMLWLVLHAKLAEGTTSTQLSAELCRMVHTNFGEFTL